MTARGPPLRPIKPQQQQQQQQQKQQQVKQPPPFKTEDAQPRPQAQALSQAPMDEESLAAMAESETLKGLSSNKKLKLL